jgi:hypothetical protein
MHHENTFRLSHLITTFARLAVDYVRHYNEYPSSHHCNIHPTICNVIQFIFLEIALHVSDGTTTHHQERKELYLQHLVFVTPLLLSAAIVEELELV